MSDSEPANPVPEPHEPAASPTEQPADPTQPDPLLESGSFIDPDRTESGAESPERKEEEQAGNVSFQPGVVIAAEPISMLRPGESSVETATPRSSVRRRNPEEMLKRPNWLPEDWKIDLRVRSSGATAGLIDRYYVEPSGQRKFRSRNEVLHFLETGNKLKRKPETETGSSGSPVGEKKQKSSGKRKKSEPSNSDNIPSPLPLNSFKADAVQKT